jgi:hypothetical protein
MKKQTLLRFLFVLPFILFAVLVSTQLPKAEAKGSMTCSVYPSDGQVFSLTDCDSFQFVSGWIAINKGLINEYQKGALVTVIVTGNGYSRSFSPNVVNKYWGDTFPLIPEDVGVDCATPYVWISDYFLPLGSLEAGTYTTNLTIDPKHPLKDGFTNACSWSDGSPIVEFPALYTEKETYINTFEVSDPYP